MTQQQKDELARSRKEREATNQRLENPTSQDLLEMRQSQEEFEEMFPTPT